MNTIITKKPLIKQGWLRVLLFCIFYFLLMTLTFVLLPVLVKTIRRNSENIEQLLNKEFLWLTIVGAGISALVAVFLFRQFIDRKSLASMGFDFSGYLKDALSGFLLAISILGIGTIILYASKHLQWTDITFSGTDLFIEFGMLLIVAFYEEIIFRGYILNNLMESFNRWIALLISAILFTAFHIDNPGINIIPLVNIFLAGLMLGINYVYTKNLWFAILLHLGWNFFQGPILGYKISGVNMPTLLQTELKGDLLLTGGDFGFEGSIFCTGLITISTLLLYRLYENREQAAKFNIQ